MRKRQRKKLARYCCPKCQNQDGSWEWYHTATGRPVSTIMFCAHCDITAEQREQERKIEEEIVKAWTNGIFDKKGE